MGNNPSGAGSRRSIAGNAASLFGAHFLAKALSFGLILVLPRVVPDAELGDYFVAIALTNLLGVLAELGMRDPLIRELHLHADRSARTLGVAVGVRAALSVLVLIACGAAIRLQGYPPRLAAMVWLLGGAEVCNGLAQVFHLLFRARERLDYESACVVAERAGAALVGGALVVSGAGGMVLFCAVALGAAILNLLLSVGAATRFARFAPRFSVSEWRDFFSLLLPFALANVLSLLYFRLDMILLREWSPLGAQAVSWYGVAYSWVMAPTIFAGAVMAAAYPAIARYAAANDAVSRAALSGVYSRAWTVLLATGAPFSVGMFLCAPALGAWYPSDRYPPGTIDRALWALAPVCGLSFLSAIVSNTLRAANRRRAIVGLVAATAALNILANAWAMPRYHHVGAGWALVASEAFFVVAGAVCVRVLVTRWTGTAFLVRVGGAIAVFGAVLWALAPYGLLVRATAAGAVYVGALFALRVVRREDLTLRPPPDTGAADGSSWRIE
jgi:O-antigen/teichoic acid export membrane protein